jgi:hypothetical protein
LNETTTLRAWRRLRRIRLTNKEFLPCTELASIISANSTEGRKMGFYYRKSASVGLLRLADTRRLPMKSLVLAIGSMSSNQSGDGNVRSARREWATNSQGLGSQRDIRRALIEADLVDCMVAASGTPKRLSCDVRN